MALNSFTSNQGTQTPILTDNTGGTSGTVIAVQKLDISAQGTAGTLWNGGVTGTINTGSIAVTAGTIGTVTALGSVSNLGSLGVLNLGTVIMTAGTIGTVVGVGSVASLGSLGMLNAGTISMINAGTLGTVTNLGSVTNLGQLYNAGTVQNQLAGTITALQNGTIVAGSIIQIAGTQSVGTVNTGTINTGTINAGTINIGTFQKNPIPTIGQSTFGTIGTTGVSIFGTLAGGTGSGAGTEIFITSLSLSIPSTAGSQMVSVGWGTNAGTTHAGTGRLAGGNFPPGGGIAKSFTPPINSGTNAQLCYFQAGAGTVNVDVTYFITPSTL